MSQNIHSASVWYFVTSSVRLGIFHSNSWIYFFLFSSNYYFNSILEVVESIRTYYKNFGWKIPPNFCRMTQVVQIWMFGNNYMCVPFGKNYGVHGYLLTNSTRIGSDLTRLESGFLFRSKNDHRHWTWQCCQPSRHDTLGQWYNCILFLRPNFY